MKIEAICATRGLHPEYLVRCTHKEVMSLGAVTFEPNENLSISHHLEKVETVMRSLQYAARAMEVSEVG